ncbi:hypothetical protein [Ilumatobacter sp.]|uniref:hypothetical protein n=1 Tax=Ilumatobacter sp. TaxID=1967498 RepID=UPI003B529BC0
MAKKKVAASRWHNGTDPIDDLSASEQLAHEIVTTRGDLEPSVQRIMSAELDEDGRTNALGAFQASLDSPGDPNRNPQVAIDNAGG